MNKKDVIKNLLSASEKMKIRAEEYLDKKLWKEMRLPQTFEELLLGMSKDELHEISRHYGFKNISSLKKNDLVHFLVKQLPNQFELELKLMDEHRYLFLKQFVSERNNEFRTLLADVYDNKLALYWRKTGIIFSGCVQGKHVLFMPYELQDIFQSLDHETLQSKLKQNTEWLLLTYGMLYYYGAMGYMKILSKLEELTGVRPDYLEFQNILRYAGEYYDAPQMDSYGYWAHQNVPDIAEVIKEHNARPEVDYYRFSKSKLLKAGEPDYFDENPAFQRLSGFLLTHYKLTEKEAKLLTVECQHIVNQSNKPTAVFDFLKTKIEFPDFYFVQRLAEVVMFFWNNTRHWALKGHSPAEIGTGANLNSSSQPEIVPFPFDKNLPFAAPVSGPAFSGQAHGKPHPKSSQHNIVDLKTRRKVGRNDPCLCGSGKKFKQCCGRS